MNAPGLLSVSEAAAQLRGENTQYNRRIIHKLIDAGELESVSIDKHKLVPLAEIKRLRGSDVERNL